MGTMDPVLFLVLQQKNHHFYSCASVDGSTQAKKRLRWHRHINAFFGLKTVVDQKSVNLGMISARHTTNRQSFKKVTCPFKYPWIYAKSTAFILRAVVKVW